MRKTLHSIIPEPEVLLSLEPEELAGVILELLNSRDPSDTEQLNRYSFCLPSKFNDYPGHHDQIAEAVMEAWCWLEREGFLASKPGLQGEWVFITRRGQKIQNQVDLDSYRRAEMLPKRHLHPTISQKIWATFLRGEYETAVFQSFKEVEVAIRNTGDFAAEDYGIKLVNKAFDPEKGSLTNKERPKSERAALHNLFLGAIGSYKDPHSHRSVEIKPGEAVEMISLASHLVKIVESRAFNA